MSSQMKTKKQNKRPETIEQEPKPKALTSVPSKIVEDGRRTTHHIIDTLAKTALAISSAENAAEKLNVIQSLWTMQKEAEDRQAEREFNVAKVSVAMELPPIPKTKKIDFVDKQNKQQVRYYADLDDIEGVLDPICRKYGIVKEYSTKTDARGWSAQICTVRHVSGHKEVYEGSYMPLDTTGAKNNNQAALSTAKYSRRGALIGAFNIYHVDDDTDGEVPEDGSPKEDKVTARVQQEAAAKTADKGKLSLSEAAIALEEKLNNTALEQRGDVLMAHIKIIGAMEDDKNLAPKAKELRDACVVKAESGNNAA